MAFQNDHKVPKKSGKSLIERFYHTHFPKQKVKWKPQIYYLQVNKVQWLSDDWARPSQAVP